MKDNIRNMNIVNRIRDEIEIIECSYPSWIYKADVKKSFNDVAIIYSKLKDILENEK